MIPLVKIMVLLVHLSLCLGAGLTIFQTSQPPVRVEFHQASANPSPGLIEATYPPTNTKVYIFPEAIIANKDILEASVRGGVPGIGKGGERKEFYGIHISFTKEAGERMAKFTSQHIGEMLAILIDGKVISVVTIQQEMHDKVQLVGAISKEEAERIAHALNRK